MSRPRAAAPAAPVTITSRDQLAAGQRSHALDAWVNQGMIVNATLINASRATTVAAFPVTPPRDAIAAVVVCRINSNTVAAGGDIVVRFFIDPTVGGQTDANMMSAQSCPMTSSAGNSFGQHIVPIVYGQLCYSWTVTGTVNADVQIYLVNFLLR